MRLSILKEIRIDLVEFDRMAVLSGGLAFFIFFGCWWWHRFRISFRYMLPTFYLTNVNLC